MPDILIRMEMPRTCVDCHDADLPTAIAWLGAKCPFAHGIIDPGVYDLRHERHPDCPLVELPQHGDLIDRDALLSRGKNNPFVDSEIYHPCVQTNCREIVMDEPVVVPAERRERE